MPLVEPGRLHSLSTAGLPHLVAQILLPNEISVITLQVQAGGNNPLPMFYPGSQAYLQQQVAAGVSTNGYQLPTTQQIRPQYVQSGPQGGQSHPQAAGNGAAALASQQRSYVSHAGAQGVPNPQLQAQNQGANGWQQAGTGPQGPALDEASRKRKAEELQVTLPCMSQAISLHQYQPHACLLNRPGNEALPLFSIASWEQRMVL